VGKFNQPPQNPVTIGSESIVVIFVGQPRSQPANESRGLLGEYSLDVGVVCEDGSGTGNLVGLQSIRIVELRPLVGSE
jgi:hypothetical protein